MAWRFKKISTRADAIALVMLWSNVFYVLAGLSAVITFVLLLLSFGDVGIGRYLGLSPDAIFSLMAGAGIIVLLTYLVQELYSRIAAALLLALSTVSFVAGIADKSQGHFSGNLYLALVAVWAAVRLTEATFKIHGRFAENRVSEQSAPQKPSADFVSHPHGGLESAAATAEAGRKPHPYDKEKWAALLKYDDEIAVVAGRVSHLGQRWLDELAHAYLALNDKQYLRKIEEKIYAEARAEAARSRL